MAIKQKKIGDVLVIRAEGSLVGRDSIEFFNTILLAIDDGNFRIVLDMSLVNDIDSDNWTNLLTLQKRIHHRSRFENNCDLRLCAVKQRVMHIFELTGVDVRIQIYKTVDEAVQSFSK